MAKKKKSLKAKLIANPGAGDVLTSASQIEQVVSCLVDAGLVVDVALAKPKRQAARIARRAVKDGFDIVISMGGDGTLGMVIRGIIGSKVKLGIIPSGTENDVAKTLGIPEDIQEACALIASGQTRRVDIGKVTTKKRKKFYFPMVTVVGIISTIYPQVKEVPEGKFSGIKDAVMTLLKYDAKPTVYLTLDGESKIKVETMLVTITNTPIIGLQNLIAPDASMEDGLLDIAVYPDFSKAQLLGYFARTARGNLPPDGSIQRYRARKIKVKTSPKLDVAAEGIVIGKGKATINMLPGAIRVFAPEAGTGIEKPPEETAQELPTPLAPISK